MEPPSSPSRKEPPPEAAAERSGILVTVVDEVGLSLPDGLIESAVVTALESRNVSLAEVAVLLTDDDVVRRLNREFRQLDESTDVLTFPAGEGADGDIAISVPYARRQARAREVSDACEIAYLTIHGALHLCGMDDEEDSDRAEMVHAMNDVAKRLGLPEDRSWSSILHEVGE